MTAPSVRPSGFAAIVLIVASYAGFAAVYAALKLASSLLDPVMAVWGRYIAQFGLALVLFGPWRRAALFRTATPWLQVGRGTMMVGSIALNTIALQSLQMAEVIAISFLCPFFTALVAKPIFGETVSGRAWVSIAIGFCGVLVVTRPWGASFDPAMLLPLAGAACAAAYNILTRILAVAAGSAADGVDTMLALSAGVVALLLAPTLPFVWSAPTSSWVWLLLILAGALGGLAQAAMFYAFRMASAAVLAPYQYSQIVVTLIFGLLLFGEVPDAMTLGGVAIVLASGFIASTSAKSRPVAAPVERRAPFLALRLAAAAMAFLWIIAPDRSAEDLWIISPLNPAPRTLSFRRRGAPFPQGR